ncbi:MAG: inorganic phosphate transporter [Marinilabiliales bacterium]|nr:inorganic phosphate transporter [Marinilabiliales bacterium]
MVNGKVHDIPHWIVLGCYSAIALGTLIGGWRIVKTMGSKITKLTPFEGVAAETAGAVLLFGTEAFGIPVSTTHTITGAIMGVGLTQKGYRRKMGGYNQPALCLDTDNTGVNASCGRTLFSAFGHNRHSVERDQFMLSELLSHRGRICFLNSSFSLISASISRPIDFWAPALDERSGIATVVTPFAAKY